MERKLTLKELNYIHILPQMSLEQLDLLDYTENLIRKCEYGQYAELRQSVKKVKEMTDTLDEVEFDILQTMEPTTLPEFILKERASREPTSPS